MNLPNKARNLEVELAIGQLKNVGLGAQSEKQAGIADALSSLNVAESLQILQLQIEESSKGNRAVIDRAFKNLIESNESLAKSNDRHAGAMRWLTIALVVITALQAIAMFI